MMQREKLVEFVDQLERLLVISRELLEQDGSRPAPVPIAPVVEFEPLPERSPRPEVDHSVGRHGLVTEQIATLKAQRLGEFTAGEFQELLGLKRSGTQRWLATLLDRKVLIYRQARYQCQRKPSMRDWVIWQETNPFTPEQAAEATGQSVDDALIQLSALQNREIVEVRADGMWAYVSTEGLTGPREHETKTPPENERPSYSDAKATGMPVRIRKDNRRMRSTAGQGHQIKMRQKRYDEQQKAKEERAEAQRAKAQQQPGWKPRGGKRRAA